MNSPQQQNSSDPVGSFDGPGAGDHDQPYQFGWRPRASVTYPFNTRQYARLLVLRGRVQDQLYSDTGNDVIGAEDAGWRPAAA